MVPLGLHAVLGVLGKSLTAQLREMIHLAHLHVLVVIVFLVALDFIGSLVLAIFIGLVQVLKDGRATHVALGSLEGDRLLLVHQGGVANVAGVLTLLAVPTGDTLARVVRRCHFELRLRDGVALLGRRDPELVEGFGCVSLVRLIQVVH